MTMPQDPYLLLSYVNTRLRDVYPTLDALCEDMEQDRGALCAKLASAGFTYSPDCNQFRQM